MYVLCVNLRIVNLSTRFNDREKSIDPIVKRIEQQYRSSPENYIVYFSSFSYLDHYHERLATRLQNRLQQSFSYTYLCQDTRKVIQASGRLIRTPDDKGVIELIDDRFDNN
ncbi:MAG: DUF2787 domain-containing protein [Oceanospirillales bacterium]|nr:MAG: DUF2787 domain-containing protein [Oceanospirillales bacterium]